MREPTRLGVPRQTEGGGALHAQRQVSVVLLLIAVVTLAVLPVGSARLGAQPSFVSAMLALVACFDLMSALFLLGQFLDTGDRVVLRLSWAYVFSLVEVDTYGATLPGAFTGRPPFALNPSTAAWIWVVWQVGPAVILAIALAPRRPGLRRPVPAALRRRTMWRSLMTCAAVAVSCTAALCLLACYLPVLMRGDGLNTRHAGPFLVLVVALATMLSWLGARSRAGPEKWAVVTAGSSLGYVVLTFTVHYRFSAGWYAGMVLTVAASAAVMLALLGEFRAMKADLAQEGEQLSAALQQAVQLQRVQRTLLDNMVDGVEFRGPDGDLVVSNLAAPELLDMSVEQMAGLVPPGPGWKAARPDGSEWAPFASSTMDAVRTGLRHRGEVVVVSTRDGRSRWLRANSVVVRDAHGSIEGVVTTFTDVTDTYGEEARLAQENQTKRERVERVLHGHEPCLRVVYQPIIDLLSRQLMGFEALSRFVSGTPDEWFSDAAAVGLGVELELHALRMAFVKHYRVPEGAYLSVNVSPQTVVSPLLADLLEGSPCERIVLEITEHVGIEDYGTLSRSLERLRSRGVRIAVDDAGAGYASLRHVLNMRPDIIKLDVGLTRGIDADPVREALAVALASFGEKIGAVLVAEGIETQSELEALVRIGLRHGQGYYLGRPADLPWCVPAENIPNCGPPTSGRGTGEA